MIVELVLEILKVSATMTSRLFCTAVRARSPRRPSWLRSHTHNVHKAPSYNRGYARHRSCNESKPSSVNDSSTLLAHRLLQRHRSVVSVAFLNDDGSKEGQELTKDAILSQFELLKDARDLRLEQAQYETEPEVETTYLSSDAEIETRYKLDRKLGVVGTGTYGTVISARCRKTGADVALKAMKKSDQPHYKREIDMLRRVNCTGCVRLLDVLESENKIFLVTELLRGGDLFDYIVDNNVYIGNLTVKQVLLLTRAMLCSLEACHLKNFAHLDVKPENFVFRDGPEVDFTNLVLVDFGAAQPFRLRPFARDRNEYQLGMDDYWIGVPDTHIGGTASYVSPEVVVDGRFSSRSDMWSMGVTLYMMLTGQRPFEVEYSDPSSSENPDVEIQSKIKVEASRARNRSIFRTCKDLQDIHPGTKRLLEEMTQPDPALRPSTTEAIHYIDKILKTL